MSGYFLMPPAVVAGLAITSANPSGSYVEGVTIAGVLTASKPVIWSVWGPDADAVTLDPGTGEWLLEETDFETKASYSFTFTAEDADENTVDQGVWITITDADETAPVLSSPFAEATGTTTADLSVDTDEGDGTLYWYVSESATPPGAFDLKAGIGADASGSQPVTAPGTQNASASGLDPDTTYYAHFLHRDAAGNDSDIATSDDFQTEECQGDPPVNILPPSISGSTLAGSALIFSMGVWSGDIDHFEAEVVTEAEEVLLARQVMDNDTGGSFPDAIGERIILRVWAIGPNEEESEPAESAPFGPIEAGDQLVAAVAFAISDQTSNLPAGWESAFGTPCDTNTFQIETHVNPNFPDLKHGFAGGSRSTQTIASVTSDTAIMAGRLSANTASGSARYEVELPDVARDYAVYAIFRDSGTNVTGNVAISDRGPSPSNIYVLTTGPHGTSACKDIIGNVYTTDGPDSYSQQLFAAGEWGGVPLIIPGGTLSDLGGGKGKISFERPSSGGGTQHLCAIAVVMLAEEEE